MFPRRFDALDSYRVAAFGKSVAPEKKSPAFARQHRNIAGGGVFAARRLCPMRRWRIRDYAIRGVQGRLYFSV
jgi:hypothetical protein